MTDRFPDFLNPAIDTDGNAISGARLFFYRVGTSTKKDTYSDSAKATPNTNPVVADSGGRFGDIFMLTDEQYKVILASAGVDDPPTGTTLKTWDNMSPVRSNPIADIDALSKSTDYTVLVGDKGKWINVDASSGAVTITLLPVATATNGFFNYVKKIDSSANVVTVDGDGAELIDGSPTFLLNSQNDTTLVATDGTVWNAFQPVQTIPFSTGHLTGLTLSNDAGDAANDVNMTAGKARDGDDTENIVLATEITKQIDAAWAVGDDAGGMDTGTVANDTTYHVWLIKRTDTGVVDALFSLSPTAPTTPANYDKKRRIGSVLRGTATNLAFTQVGDEFLLTNMILSVDAANPGTGAVTETLDVPTGVKVRALIHAHLVDTVYSAALAGALSSLDQAAPAPVAGGIGQLQVFGSATFSASGDTSTILRTNTSAQIRSQLSASDANISLRITTEGWLDRRGRDD